MSDESEAEWARQYLIERLTEDASQAAARDAEPFWHHGDDRPQRWAKLGFDAAIGALQRHSPEPGESKPDYLARVRERIAACRGDGSFRDDEGWYDGAIDTACKLIGILAS